MHYSWILLIDFAKDTPCKHILELNSHQRSACLSRFSSSTLSINTVKRGNSDDLPLLIEWPQRFSEDWLQPELAKGYAFLKITRWWSIWKSWQARISAHQHQLSNLHLCISIGWTSIATSKATTNRPSSFESLHNLHTKKVSAQMIPACYQKDP